MKIISFRGYAIALCVAALSLFAVPAAAHERYGLFDFPVLIDARAVGTVAHEITVSAEEADAATFGAIQRERTYAFNRRLHQRAAPVSELGGSAPAVPLLA